MSEFNGFTSTSAADSFRAATAVPNDWRSVKSGEIFEFNNGKAFYSDGYSDEGYRVIDLLNIDRAGKFQITKKDKFVSEDVYEKYPKAHLFENDLIIIMTDITPTLGLIGRTAVIDKSNTYVLNQRVGCLRPKNDNASIKFMNFMFNSDVIRLQVITNTLGTAQFYVNTPVLRNLDVPFPPLPEQIKIAQILTSVDEVIEKTQAQIDKLKDLKTAMMQELLTKGIGHVEFKDSPVGMIPVGWKVVEISKLCSDVVDCVNKTAPVVDYKTQYKMIRTTNVRHGRVDTENVRNVTKETYEAWTRRLRPENGDLIFTREAPVGECGVLEDSRGVFLGQRTMMYRANEQLTSSKFLMYSLTSNYGKQQLEDFSGGSTVAHMRVPDCSKILIKTPPIEEQNKIVIAISSIDDSVQKKERKLAAIDKTKKALMQDLLTGKVRVNVNV